MEYTLSDAISDPLDAPRMKKFLWLAAALPLLSVHSLADIRELISEDVLMSIAEETSGEAAKRNLDTITLQHRMRASSQFDAATQHIVEQLAHYGLDEVGTLEYAADGETMFGTQKSRPVWEVRFAQLWEVKERDGAMRRVRKLGDWDSVPLTLAQDSLSADVTASLVDIGSGTEDSDFDGKDLAGKLVTEHDFVPLRVVFLDADDVRSADPAGSDGDEHLIGTGRGLFHLDDFDFFKSVA